MRKLFGCLAISLLLFSCKKDEATTTNPATKTKTQYLTQKSWRDSIVLNRPDTNSAWTPAALFASAPDVRDDTTRFKTDFSYAVGQGSLLYYPTQPQILETGTWGFTSNETHLNYNRNVGGGTQTLDWKIEQLDDNIFTYTYYYFPSGGPYYKITMVH